MRRLVVAAAAALTTLGVAAPAHAGSYTVRSCLTSAGTFPNEAWVLRDSASITTDNRCGTAPTDSIGPVLKAGGTINPGDYEAMTFTSPVGTTIGTWVINRRWTLKGAAPEGRVRPYVLYVYGASNVFGGGGRYTAAVRDELSKASAWAGYPENDFAISGTTPRSSWKSLAGDPAQRTLSVRVGCLPGTTPCAVPAAGLAENLILGSSVTVDDPTPPVVSIQAAGLFAGGEKPGSEPVVVNASDGAGIKTVQVIDVTDPAAPVVVGAADYTTAATAAGATCAFSRPAPCPQLTGEPVALTQLQAGRRNLIVRATDAGDNVTDTAPSTVVVSAPSDRGAPNGAGATDTATLTARFRGKGKPRSRSVGYGKRPGIGGTLTNAAGQPVAGAVLDVSTRRAGSGRWAPTGTVRTGTSGRWSLKVKRGPSRGVRVGWRARANDVAPAAAADLALRVRGSAKLRAPRSVALGRAFTLRGRLKGAGRNRRVSLVAQGKGAQGGFQTFRDTRTDGKGRIKVRYRFTQPGSRGTTFRIRVKLLATRGWPYAPGTTRTVRIRVR